MLDLSKYEGHTPGPWAWDSYSAILAKLPKGHPLDESTDDEPGAGALALMAHPEGERGDMLRSSEQMANARLIADAPALLAELKALRESHARLLSLAVVAANYFANRHGSCGCYQGECVMCKRWLDKLDAAQEAINQAKAL